MHLFDANGEAEKLSSLDGPAQESFRVNEQIRCFYPDAKVMRIDARTAHNGHSRRCCRKQVSTLLRPVLYFFSQAPQRSTRVAGAADRQAYRCSELPKDGLRCIATNSGPRDIG